VCFENRTTEIREIPEANALIGYRRFNMQGDRLVPTAYTVVVPHDGGGGSVLYPIDGPLKAVCGEGRNHESPELGCSCGIHAYADLDVLRTKLQRSGPITGQVKLWGRVSEHHDRTYPDWVGYRAQFARVLRIAVNPYYNPYGSTSENLAAIAQSYGIPAFEDEESLVDGIPIPTQRVVVNFDVKTRSHEAAILRVRSVLGAYGARPVSIPFTIEGVNEDEEPE
jgi:hypothetical protein